MSKSPRAARIDGEVTRARILEAAGALFGTAGFAETTSKAIAAKAEVDLASINYHFGGRDWLYQAVLVEAHRRVLDVTALQHIAESELPASEKLRSLFEQLVPKTMGDANSWHLTVLASEIFAPSSHLQVLMQSEVPIKVSLILGLVAQLTGIPMGNPALLRCLLSVVAPCLMLLIGQRNIPGPIQEISALPREETVEHLYHFALAGLEAAGRRFRAEPG
ncbi:TetR/AcrR family transcriptional regulator [Pseudomonas sp. BNK-30]|uniref:TetR/AcrR family transcriptional regulator n=1 Tax=Pseudomonas sp. BNK-30 TaxID=3376165 RepID=UPI0039BEE13A